MRHTAALIACLVLTPNGAVAGAPPTEGDLIAQQGPVRPIEPLPRNNRRNDPPNSRDPRRGSQPPRTRSGNTGMTVPVDIGIGPFAAFITGPVQDDQLIHTGLRFSVAAVIDRETIRKNRDRIPPQYRGMVNSMDEVRVKPLLATLIPTTLYISPAIYNTSVYGATWELLGLGVPLISDPVRFSIDAGLIFTYLYISSDTLDSPTHFVRPGLELSAELEIPFTNDFLMSLGWASQLHPPQLLGGLPWEALPLSNTVWHSGLLFLQMHVRVPYTP
jgi:hypothetical protein